MSLPKPPNHGRDERAADRDDAADQRDIDADQRDDVARVAADDLDDRVQRVSLQILDRLARIENTTLDHADWLDLNPAAFARLDAYTAEQRRLAGLDRAAVYALLDDLHDAVGDLRAGKRAASGDRHHSLRDRHHSGGDRHDGGQDRGDAGADRDQAAIDREQVDARDLPPVVAQPVERQDPPQPGDPKGRAAQALATSRRRISDGRNYLAGIARRPTPSTASAPEPASEPEP